MANTIETDSEAPQSVTTVTTWRAYALNCCGLVFTLLLIAVLIIVSAVVLLTSKNTILVFSIIIVILLIVAGATFGFIEWQRREAIRKRDEGAKAWIQRTLSQDKLPAPSAPPESAVRSSWMFWRKAPTPNGTASGGLQAPLPSAPPHSTRSSWTLSRKSYLPVYVAENRGR